MVYFAGIDVGSSTTKCVIIDKDKKILSASVIKSGVDFRKASFDCYETCIQKAKIEKNDVKFLVATGYGRRNVHFADRTRTEISCHAMGSFFYFPWRITIIDIGGEDAKIIKLDDKGKKIGFKMNRKCSAGTGAFLEVIAERLSIALSDMDSIARKSKKNVSISSYCTVFASTEVLKRVRFGEKLEDIVKGVYGSVVDRVIEMDVLSGNIVLTGGVVAHHPFICEILKEKLESSQVFIPPYPQEIGAFGAALFALESSLH